MVGVAGEREGAGVDEQQVQVVAEGDAARRREAGVVDAVLGDGEVGVEALGDAAIDGRFGTARGRFRARFRRRDSGRFREIPGTVYLIRFRGPIPGTVYADSGDDSGDSLRNSGGCWAQLSKLSP